MACEGCSIKFTILKRKRKCEDCGYIFCSDCVTPKNKLYQCYRCKILTCVPLNCDDVASLKLKDLQWFLETKDINVPCGDLREKSVLVEVIMAYSRQAQSSSSTNVLYPSLLPTEDLLYPSLNPTEGHMGGLFGNEPNSSTSRKHQIIDLECVDSVEKIFELSTMELKLLLTRNFISFRGCCEKSELQEKVCWLWKLKEAAKSKDIVPDENLCKICMESTIDSLFLDCGHMVTCTQCGKLLHDCPICRQIIVRVVRAFKS
ncbi:E3 ubiquitin-protein ligase RNF34-like isoform X2 [Stegodyphus dumicola]|uniref:E3 ubiquitin-protein ligase RNF34-like isoform X2 n=1 Tax=Stegodyphus dumicola TaxID=202533 RepID=UPI0015A78267|nr:E3 ubiquitin-protein ligase RNF34-like isoform X2 [Stegodyphus dumicola]